MYCGKPVIAVTSSFEKKEDIRRVFLLTNYLEAIRHFGGFPLLIPTGAGEEEMACLLEQCDGLLLTGGNDIDPAHYGEPVWNDTVEPAAERDETELKLCAMATERKKPILGICRGFQLLNVFFGGSLYQDLPTQYESAVSHRMAPPDHRTCHNCLLEADSPLRRLTGKAEIAVNSHHHQAVKYLAPGLAVMGRCSDGIIEAIHKPGEVFCWGVQWHPEKIWDIEPSSASVFEAFLEACKA